MPNLGIAQNISYYTFGTTRLGDKNISFADRVKTARAAMETGVYFHTSRQYGDALEVLGKAFKETPSKIPKLIIKIGGGTIAEFRDDIRKNLEPLGVQNLEIAQLCIGGSLAEEFAVGGNCYKEFEKLRSEGIVNNYVMEVFPWTSEGPLKALRGGYPVGIVEAYITYFNPLQRFASNDLWRLLVEKKFPILALRTIAGGPVHRLRDVPGAAWVKYLQERAVEVAPIFERSGIANWVDFCLRWARSFPQVLGTIGATSKIERLQEALSFTKSAQPLPQDIVAEISALQTRWSDETDIKAKPWTM